MVDCAGEGRRRRGGLALLWRDDINIRVSSFSGNHIDVIIEDEKYGEWRFSGVYGFPEEENKYKTGLLMNDLAAAHNLPWLCGGDFNLMMMASEKLGGGDFKVQEAEILRSAVEICGFEDLGYIGHDYTWTNNRGGEDNIQERLDRFFANERWRGLFAGTFVTHLPKRKSNHLPLVLCMKESRGSVEKRSKRKLFRFEAMWLREEESTNVVSAAWRRGEDASMNLSRTANKLSVWSRKVFGNTAKEIRECQHKMKALMEVTQTQEVVQQMRILDSKMDELESREEVYWQQRSRQVWLQSGDKNTAFFHNKAKHREHRN